MFVIHSYAVAVIFCLITMLCWGSWANTQKLAKKSWAFQLFYWDYALGILILSLVLALTMGSTGSEGRAFIADLQQASRDNLISAFIGGIVFNIANILLVAAIDIAGMAVAFPIAIGLALVLGVIVNYVSTPIGNPLLLFLGVIAIVIAIIVDAIAYRRLKIKQIKSAGVSKGVLIAVIAGILMGFFYHFVAKAMTLDFVHPQAGMLTPYTAMFIFATGIFLSNFIVNGWMVKKPIVGKKLKFTDYFTEGNPWLHFVGILGGIIWGIGSLFNFIASGLAGAAISYGLGQGATMIAALWGVFIWKEFNGAPDGTNKLLSAMFIFYLLGLVLIILARVV